MLWIDPGEYASELEKADDLLAGPASRSVLPGRIEPESLKVSIGDCMTYRAIPVDELVRRTLTATDGEPMAFFLGAGASRSLPACLPRPEDIQRAAFSCVAPPHSDADRKLICSSLPEIYHEVLLDIGGEATREIWETLRTWESPSTPLARFSLGPNLVHLLVVYLSWRARLPVLTVNFDQMLEKAAERLGLQPRAMLDASTTDDEIAVWKLHGSVSDLMTVRTTLQGITARDPLVLKRVEHVLERATGCLIGYSGKDVDFFPSLCAWENVRRPFYWLSLNLNETTITRAPDAFLGVDAQAEVWARRVIERMSADDNRAVLLKEELTRSQPDVAEVEAANVEVVESKARRVYDPVFPPNHAKRVLAHATTLAALGENRRASCWLNKYPLDEDDERLNCQAHILRSALAHEFARYEESKQHAIAALAIARKNKLAPHRIQAILRIDEANRMLYLPPRLPVAQPWRTLAPRSLAALLTMWFHAFSLRGALRAVNRASQEMPSYSELRAAFEYVEHLVRLAAVPQGIAERILPRTFTGRLFVPWWNYIEAVSYGIGYMFGIGNSKKYNLRRAAPDDRRRQELPVLDLYRLVPAPTGSSLHYRDIADVLAAESRAMTSGPEKEQVRRESVKNYEEARRFAKEAGDPSLELKALFGLHAMGVTDAASSAEVRALLRRIQSPAYAAIADHIIEVLTAA